VIGRLGRAAAPGVALLALVGCAPDPGIYAASVGPGTDGRIGTLTVADAVLSVVGSATDTPGPPQEVDISATIVNAGPVADRLVGVHSPIAGLGLIVGDAGLPAGGVLVTASSGPPPVGTTAVELRLSELRGPVRPGLSYPVTFDFDRAGALTLQLSLADPDQPRPDCPLPPNGKLPQVFTAPSGAPLPPATPPPRCSSLLPDRRTEQRVT
jgi:hypothetical protein